MRRRSLLRRGAAVGCAVAVGGCLEGSAASDDTDFEQAWQSDVGGRIRGLADDVVICQGDIGVDEGAGFFALDVETGETQWTYGGAGGFARYTGPVIDDGIYFGLGDDASGSGAGQLYALAFDGTERWTYETGSVYLPPRVDDGVVYVGSDDGAVRAIGARDGEKRWKTDLGQLEKTLSSVHVVSVDDAVYVTGGPVFALDRRDGSVLWRYDGLDDVERATVVDGTVYAAAWDAVVAVDGGEERWRAAFHDGNRWIEGVEGDRLLVEADGRLHALDVTSGEKQWATGEFSHLRVAANDGTVYVGGDRLAAFAADDGTERWGRELENGRVVESLSVDPPGPVRGIWDDDRLFAWTDDRLIAFDDAGERTWAREFDGDVISHHVDDDLYAGTRESVYALEPS